MNGEREDVATMMPEPAAAALLETHGIAYVEHGVALTADEAVAVAAQVGYPVVLKVVSPDVVHKTEVGGVLVGLTGDEAVRAAYSELRGRVAARAPDVRIDGVIVGRQIEGGLELIVGALRDETFGPTVMVGLGGIFAEALDDVSFRLAPLSTDEAGEMLNELASAALIRGHRGGDCVDAGAVAEVIARLGDLLIAHPEVAAVDLNPVIATASGCVALDARIMS